MSHLLALEWDAHEARLVLARRRGKSAQIEQAFAIDLRAPTGEGTPADNATSEIRLAKRLGEILREQNISRAETLVAVGRASIELRLLSLPPVPPDELPDLVRFQALKQFSSVGDNWPIDFVPLGVTEQGPLSVLAAAIAPDLVEQIKTTCTAAQLQPRRLVLRPFAAASLWAQNNDVTGCVLMVDLLAEDGDLTVVVDGQVAFIRTVRLPAPENSEDLARAMSGEIRRTMAAASNQLGGRRVDRVVVCGTAQEFTDLRQLITQQTNLPCQHFDPFEGLDVAGPLANGRPPHGGRFAPLLGMICDEAAGNRTGIDFLNPRKRPEPPNRKRQYAIIGATVVVALLALVFMIWQGYTNLDEEIAGMKREATNLDAEIKRLEKPQREAGEIDDFVSGDIVWIDELCEISLDFLSPDSAIVSTLSGMVGQNGGGIITVEGHLKQSSDIEDLESRLRDEQHSVRGSGTQFDSKENQYPWTFKETLTIPRIAVDEPKRRTVDDAATDEKAQGEKEAQADKKENPAADASKSKKQDKTDTTRKTAKLRSNTPRAANATRPTEDRR